MSKHNSLHPLLLTILHLSFLLFQTHFTLCNGILTSLERGGSSSIDAIVRIGQDHPEMMESSEISSGRRILVGQQRRSFISYETLNKDMVPCGKPGASYYDCHGEVAANPYSRGCEIITRCARDIHETIT